MVKTSLDLPFSCVTSTGQSCCMEAFDGFRGQGWWFSKILKEMGWFPAMDFNKTTQILAKTSAGHVKGIKFRTFWRYPWDCLSKWWDWLKVIIFRSQNFNGRRFRSQQWPAEKKRGCDRVLHRTISSRCLQTPFTTTAPAGRSCAGTKRPRPSLEMEGVHIGPSIWCFFHLIYLIVWWTNQYMYIWQDIP